MAEEEGEDERAENSWDDRSARAKTSCCSRKAKWFIAHGPAKAAASVNSVGIEPDAGR